MPHLLSVPAKHRWISLKPFIGEVNLDDYLTDDKVEWVLAGGENYLGSRPLHYEWVKSAYESCVRHDVKFTFGQTGNIFIQDGAERKNHNRTEHFVVCGVAICALVLVFLRPMLVLFGATENILPYAMQYAEITAFGIPFLLFSTGTNPLARADGSPKYSMIAIIIGAVLNTIPDPVFILRFGWGIAGAAFHCSFCCPAFWVSKELCLHSL